MRRTFLRCSLRRQQLSLGSRRFDVRCDRPSSWVQVARCRAPAAGGPARCRKVDCAIGGLPEVIGEAASFWPRGPLAWGRGIGPDPMAPMHRCSVPPSPSAPRSRSLRPVFRPPLDGSGRSHRRTCPQLDKTSCHKFRRPCESSKARTGPARSAPVPLWLVAARPIEPSKGGTMPKISLGIQ
jgi:hypothetical protein